MDGHPARQHTDGAGIARRVDVSQRREECGAESELLRPRQSQP
jgi:hypothetical protein